MPNVIASLAGTVVFSTLIAAFLTAIGFGGGFVVDRYAQFFALSD